MAKTKLQKEIMLRDISEGLKKAKSVVFTVNKGINAEQMVELRNKMFENQAKYEVTKKTLLKIALKESEIDFDEVSFDGAINTVYSFEDEIIGPKVIHEFAKETDNVEIVGGVFEGKFLSKDEVTSLATMPSKDELYAKIVGSMNSPISGFVNTLAGTIRGFVQVVNAVKEKKEATA